MDMFLKGKVAFITGAASGIGRQTALTMAQEGANIVIADKQYDKAKQVAEECKKLGVDAIAPPCDVRKLDEASAAVKAAMDHFKKIDILVCCAGVLEDAMIHKMTEAQWDEVLNVHLKGHWWLCHDIVPLMKAAKYGRIVFIASTALRGTRGQSNYASAKAAMVGLAKSIAYETGYLGITCNIIGPGLVDTPLTHEFIIGEHSKPMIDSILLKRREDLGPHFATTQDIANAVTFLASDRASYITGEVLLVAGGRMI